MQFQSQKLHKRKLTSDHVRGVNFAQERRYEGQTTDDEKDLTRQPLDRIHFIVLIDA